MWATDSKLTLEDKRSILSNFFKNYTLGVKARSKIDRERQEVSDKSLEIDKDPLITPEIQNDGVFVPASSHINDIVEGGDPRTSPKNSSSNEERLSVLSYPSDEENLPALSYPSDEENLSALSFPSDEISLVPLVAKDTSGTEDDNRGMEDKTQDKAIISTSEKRPLGFWSRDGIVQIRKFFRNPFRRGRNRTAVAEEKAMGSCAENKPAPKEERLLTKQEQRELYLKRIKEFQKENSVGNRKKGNYPYSEQFKEHGKTEERLGGGRESKEIDYSDGDKHQIHEPSELGNFSHVSDYRSVNSNEKSVEDDSLEDQLGSTRSNEEVDSDEEISIIFDRVDEEARSLQQEETSDNGFDFTQEDIGSMYEESVDSYKLEGETNQRPRSGDQSDDKLNTTLDELIHQFKMLPKASDIAIYGEEVPKAPNLNGLSDGIIRTQFNEATAAARAKKNKSKQKNKKKSRRRGKNGPKS